MTGEIITVDGGLLLLATRNEGIEYSLYCILGIIYFGSWFPAMLIYSKITFTDPSSYLASFGILFFTVLPPLLFGNRVARLLRRVGAFAGARIGLALEAVTAGLLLRVTQQALVLLVIAGAPWRRA